MLENYWHRMAARMYAGLALAAGRFAENPIEARSEAGPCWLWLGPCGVL